MLPDQRKLVLVAVAQRQPGVLRQVCGVLRDSTACMYPCRGSAQPVGCAGQFASHPVGVGLRAKAQGQIDTRLNQIDGHIVQQQAQPQLRKTRQPGSQRRGGMVGKAHGRSQTQLATGNLLLGGQFGACAFGCSTERGALHIKALACIGQGNLPGRAVQQRDAAFTLQLADVLAHGRRAHAQAACCRSHGAVLHDGGKNCHAFEIVHALYCEVQLQSVGGNCVIFCQYCVLSFSNYFPIQGVST